MVNEVSPMEWYGAENSADRDLLTRPTDAGVAMERAFVSAQLTPLRTGTESANNIVKFLRGGGKTAFDWGGVISNLFSHAAMLVAPMLGGGAELKVLKLNGVLPDDVSGRDLQMGGAAAQHAGVTPEQMAAWNPEQRAAFLIAGADLIEQRQKSALTEDTYHAELNRLVAKTDATTHTKGLSTNPGQAVNLPELQETVYVGPPSPRVRELMDQGHTREEAEKIASNEAVFAGGTGRNAANVETADEAPAGTSPDAPVLSSEQQRLADTLEGELSIPAPLARHIVSEGLGFLSRYDQTYLGGYSTLSLEDETGKPIVDYDIVSVDDDRIEVVKHPTYDDAANYPTHLGDPDARPPHVGDPLGYAPYNQRRVLTADDLPEILRANPGIVHIYRGDMNLKDRLGAMQPGDTLVVIRDFGEIHFRDRGEPREQDVVIQANDDGTWTIRDNQQSGPAEKSHLPGEEVNISMWHEISGSATFIHSNDFEYTIRLPDLPSANDGR